MGSPASKIAEALEKLKQKAAQLRAKNFQDEATAVEQEIDTLERSAPEGVDLTPIQEATEGSAQLPPSAKDYSSWTEAESKPDDFSDWLNPTKKKVALGAGLLGASSQLGEGDTRPPVVVPEEEKKQEEAKSTLTPEVPEDKKNNLPTITTHNLTLGKVPDLLAAYVKSTKQPGDLDFSEWNNKMGGLAEQRQSKADEFKQDMLAAMAVADAANTSLEKRELMENITNAIGQLVGGFYGLRTGYDLSGAVFKATDWNKKMDQVRNDLRVKMEQLTTDQNMQQRVIEDKKDALLRDKDQLLHRYEDSWRRYDAGLKIAEAQQAQANLQQGREVQVGNVNITQANINERAQAAMQAKIEAATSKAGKLGGSVTKQADDGVQAWEDRVNGIKAEWQKRMAEANNEKLGDSARKQAILQAGQLETEHQALTGTPILLAPRAPGDKTGFMKAVDYNTLNPSGVNRAMMESDKEREALMSDITLLAEKNDGFRKLKQYLTRKKDAVYLFTQDYLSTGQHTPGSAVSKAAGDIPRAVTRSINLAREGKLK